VALLAAACGGAPATRPRQAGPHGVTVRLVPVKQPPIDAFLPATGATDAVVASRSQDAAAISAGTIGLYGGTEHEAACDTSSIIASLRGASLLTAWSAVLGVGPSELDAFTASLTPVVLRADTLVTRHGYRDRAATSAPAVLEAGTAVLVDPYGNPVMRCSSGDPLTGTDLTTAALHTALFTGAAWTGFRADGVAEVTSAPTRLDTLVLTGLGGGSEFSRPIGTSGDADESYTPVGETDWARATILTPSCVNGAAEKRATLANGEAEAHDSAGAAVTLHLAAHAIGAVLPGAAENQAAVLLDCQTGDGASATTASVVQVYSDGPNLLGTLTVPAVDGQAPDDLVAASLAITGGSVVIAADYPPAAGDAAAAITRRTFAWAWNGSGFDDRVTDTQKVSSDVPAAFIGTWTGTLADQSIYNVVITDSGTTNGATVNEEVTVRIVGGQVGQAVGTITYDCGAQPLKLLGVGSAALHLEEESPPCSAAIVRITAAGPGQLKYTYDPSYDPSFGPNQDSGGGVLTRRGG
jgi:hypothetical protein